MKFDHSIQLKESFGKGNSAQLFKELLKEDYFFKIPLQKKLNY